ncbi:unnamed protein product [Schistosoma mattheei]|uniref:Uncharacterized protein n=1 Tax=Schistosoma mattheei TaxID=31246 RepID=A0A183PIU9_9TREM|nr:unnamed protein product [Schistosoma mattheei]
MYLGPWYENQSKIGNINNSDMNNNTNNVNDDTCEKLLEGIAEAKCTIDLFLNNRFEEAKNRLHMNTHSGMYQELSNSTILFIQGMATIEQVCSDTFSLYVVWDPTSTTSSSSSNLIERFLIKENLETAKEQLKTTLKACQANRRKAAISETFTKQIEKSQQAHAELCYAEGLLQLAFLSMLQDEKLTSLIKCSLKIRQCYKCYRLVNLQNVNVNELKIIISGLFTLISNEF